MGLKVRGQKALIAERDRLASLNRELVEALEKAADTFRDGWSSSSTTSDRSKPR